MMKPFFAKFGIFLILYSSFLCWVNWPIVDLTPSLRIGFASILSLILFFLTFTWDNYRKLEGARVLLRSFLLSLETMKKRITLFQFLILPVTLIPWQFWNISFWNSFFAGEVAAYLTSICAFFVQNVQYGAQRREIRNKWHNQGLEHLIKGEYALAVPNFTKAIFFYPHSPRSFSLRARAYFHLGKPKKAIVDARESIKLAPSDPHGWYEKGNALLMLGDYENAIKDFLFAIELGTPSTEKEKQGNHLQNFVKNLEPHFSQVLYLRGHLKCHWFRDYQGAEADCNEAINQDPNNGYAYIVRAQARGHLGKKEEAIADHTKAIKLLRNDPYTFLSRGQAYSNQGFFDEAFFDFGEAIRLKPTLSMVFLCRAEILIAKGELNQALWDLNRLVDLEPENPLPYEKRSQVFRLKGDLNKAGKDEIKALSLKKKLGKSTNNHASFPIIEGG